MGEIIIKDGLYIKIDEEYKNVRKVLEEDLIFFNYSIKNNKIYFSLEIKDLTRNDVIDCLYNSFDLIGLKSFLEFKLGSEEGILNFIATVVLIETYEQQQVIEMEGFIL